MVCAGPSRDVARQLMDRALEQYQVVGLPTNLEFLRKAVRHEAFAKGGVDTGFLEVGTACSCSCVGVHAPACIPTLCVCMCVRASSCVYP